MATNPSTATATVVVAALIDLGVTDVVLAPGSRNAPLSLALAEAERDGALALHVRVDERSAGFLALGLAKRSRNPVPVVVTSGTAAAELLPAMVEASLSGVPLVALTADRPAELRNTGANQTIDQAGLFGSYSRLAADLPAADIVAERSLRLAQSTIARALAACRDPLDPGPVHVNIAFRDPLVSDDSTTDADVAIEMVERVMQHPIITRDARLTATMAIPADDPMSGIEVLPTRGVIVVGDPVDDESREAAAALADACGWPLICEPSGLPSDDSDALIAHAPLLLADDTFRAHHRADLVITVGRVGLSRPIMRLIAESGSHVVVDPRPAWRWADPLRSAAAVLGAVPEPPEEFDHDPTWLASWLAASVIAEDVVSDALDGEGALSGPAVARLLFACADSRGVLLVGASWPVRHLESFSLPRDHMPLVVGNRGASGIDGLLSTAWGVALAHGGAPAYALVGDLSFLYDINALLVGARDAQPDLTIVVIDNDGGGIFSSLEQGADRFADSFERVFGTPHSRDVVSIAHAMGVPAVRVTTALELVAALDAGTSGVRVVVADTGSRADEAHLVRTIGQRVSDALNAEVR